MSHVTFRHKKMSYVQMSGNERVSVLRATAFSSQINVIDIVLIKRGLGGTAMLILN